MDRGKRGDLIENAVLAPGSRQATPLLLFQYSLKAEYLLGGDLPAPVLPAPDYPSAVELGFH